VGVFKIGRPIGRRCITKFGSDVLCITADGLTPLSKGLLTDRTQPQSQITYKILNAINQDVVNYNSNFGWQVIEYPLGEKLIVNVPETSDATSHQWVKSTARQDDGGWSRFRNWNAFCWEIQQDNLYFGAFGSVMLADQGTSDGGNAITVDCLPAFSTFDLPGVKKVWDLAHPIFQCNVTIQPVLTLNVDYQQISPSSIPLFQGNTSLWDVSPWDVTPWGDQTPNTTIENWQGIPGVGYAASTRLTMQVLGIQCQWNSTDHLFRRCAPI
jgi:hypothetical protein